MGRKAFTPEQELAVCEMYERVERAAPIAEAFNVSSQTVCRVLEKHGIPRTHRHPKKKSGTGSNHKGIDRSKVGELYKEGLSVADIAREMGCSYQTVYYHLGRLGLYEPSKRTTAIDALVSQILELHEQGMSDYEIADDLGVSRSVVNYRLRKAGIRRGRGCGDPHKGGAAYAKKMRDRAIERLDANPAVELVEFGSHVKVLCKRCGTEYEWTRESWRSTEPCPGCRELQRDANRAARDRKQYEREQQREAAREWRLSVPRICKECGGPFYSEFDSAAYCCDACRRRASNRRKLEKKANRYRHRMRIEVTRLTYDRTVTLDAVYRKFRGRCCECGCETERASRYSPRMATLDHIVALNNNGTHTWDNVQLLCSDCNSKKRDLGQMRLPMAI